MRTAAQKKQHCEAEKRRYWNNPERFRRKARELAPRYRDTRKTKSGVTRAEKFIRLQAQGGICAICTTDTPGGRGWAMDHDHTTGIIREVLCHWCNAALGHARDDLRILAAMVTYLEKHR